MPDNQYTETTDTTSNLNQEVKDSLVNLNSKFDSLSTEVQSATNSVVTLEESVSKLEIGKNRSWIALAAAMIAFLSSIIGIVKCGSLRKRLKQQGKVIDELRIRIQNLGHAPKGVSKSSDLSSIEMLRHKVEEMEKSIKGLKASVLLQNPVPINPSYEPMAKKQGYFGNPVATSIPYFKNVLEIYDTDARFKVEINGSKAIFKPLDILGLLGTFVSNDAMRSAIEFDSKFPPKEARAMRLKIPGEAELRDNRWYITKKAIVILSR